jgi:hypothetical protein
MSLPEAFIAGFAVGFVVGFFLGWRICQKQEKPEVTIQVPPNGNGGGKPK